MWRRRLPVMATNRFRRLRQVLDSARVGRPTLATGQMTGMGPAAWHDDTGDAAAFYAAGGGPLFDTGIYVLHAITGLLGPARRVQALGAVAIPRRRLLAPRHAGRVIEVDANDHMLVQLQLANGGLAQIVASFAVPRSAAPPLEIHCTRASISVRDIFNPNGDGSTEVFLFDESTIGLSGRLADAGLRRGAGSAISSSPERRTSSPVSVVRRCRAHRRTRNPCARDHGEGTAVRAHGPSRRARHEVPWHADGGSKRKDGV